MTKFGLKLWSTNDQYLQEAQRLFAKCVFQYIELYVVTNTLKSHLSFWQKLEIPFIVHAPHFKHGFNLADQTKAESNLAIFKEAQDFAAALNAPFIIVHPGIAGDTQETIRQMKLLNDRRILVENKPYFSIDGKYVCNGATIEEIEQIVSEVGCGFCLDIGHAIYAANACKIKPLSYLKKFVYLKPTVVHLTDGDFHGVVDQHKHFGQGDFPLGKILPLLPQKKLLITIETEKCKASTLDDFEQDLLYLNKTIADVLPDKYK